MSGREPTSRQRLDRLLKDFVDAAIGGRDDEALRCFADAQAVLGRVSDLQATRDEAREWVTAEQRVASRVRADVEDLSQAQQLVCWGKARGRLGGGLR